jgi:hypothetical protein
VEADARGLPLTQATFGQAMVTQLPTLPSAAVQARAHRAYPAFVRQHHFKLALRVRFPFTLRGHPLDMAGLDVLIIDRTLQLGNGTVSAQGPKAPGPWSWRWLSTAFLGSAPAGRLRRARRELRGPHRLPYHTS